jgi:hypothetical protein
MISIGHIGEGSSHPIQHQQACLKVWGLESPFHSYKKAGAWAMVLLGISRHLYMVSTCSLSSMAASRKLSFSFSWDWKLGGRDWSGRAGTGELDGNLPRTQKQDKQGVENLETTLLSLETVMACEQCMINSLKGILMGVPEPRANLERKGAHIQCPCNGHGLVQMSITWMDQNH